MVELPEGTAYGQPLVIYPRRLVVPFEASLESPRGYVLLASAMGMDRPEVRDFVAWMRSEASGAL